VPQCCWRGASRNLLNSSFNSDPKKQTKTENRKQLKKTWLLSFGSRGKVKVLPALRSVKPCLQCSKRENPEYGIPGPISMIRNNCIELSSVSVDIERKDPRSPVPFHFLVEHPAIPRTMRSFVRDAL